MNKNFKEDCNKIALTPYRQVNGYAFPMTDYARACLGDYTRLNENDKLPAFWVRNPIDATLQGSFAPVFTFKYDDASKNSNADMDIRVMNRKQYAEINGKVVYYPQTRVASDLEETLFENQDAMQKVGEFARPVKTLKNEHVFDYEADACYEFQGQYYVKVCDWDYAAWYHCEPVQACNTSRNTMQCRNVLMVPPFSDKFGDQENLRIRVDMKALDQFLTNEMWQNVALGTSIEPQQKRLAKLQPAFATSALKQNGYQK